MPYTYLLKDYRYYVLRLSNGAKTIKEKTHNRLTLNELKLGNSFKNYTD